MRRPGNRSSLAKQNNPRRVTLHPWALFIKRRNFVLTLQIVLALLDVVSVARQLRQWRRGARLCRFSRSRRVSVTPRRVTEWPSSPI